MNQLLGSQKQTLFSNLKVAKTFGSRSIGLIGTKQLSESEALWIMRCNSIHTCFMSMPIDCVFLNSKLQVVDLKRNVKPWRMTFPVWKASTVVEMKSGLIDLKNIRVGDQLYVVN